MEAIVAVNRKNIIGNENTIPWYVPEDLQYFRKTTQNHIVIMGRKTYESFPNGPLPKRLNIVLTRNPDKMKHLESKYTNKQLLITTPEEFLTMWKRERNKNLNKKWFIIGGQQIYDYFFPYYEKLYVTFIMNNANGDTSSPFTVEKLKEHNFNIVERGTVQKSKSDVQFQHIIYEKS